MISIVYCTREENKQHSEHLKKVSGNPNVEVIEYINKGEGLTKFYNKGLNESKYDIVLFVHDDIIIDSKQIASKIVRMFDNNPEYGIIGVAGTKYMSESGRWWDNPKFMYGRVTHMHEGRTWLSEYSGDQDKRIEEMVIVDGLFFAVNKTRIKKQFDESVQGFHFYDVDFCFQNYLEGVKVGVTTEIKVTHKSIGMTNEEWELNRQEFVEKFKDKLPVKLKKVFRKGEKLNLMITSLHFDDNNHKSKLILEFAKKLKGDKHNVVICSKINGALPVQAKRLGITLASIEQPPGFALGDGKWLINESIVSEPNKLYKVKDYKFDIIHTFDDEIIKHITKLYNDTSIVNTKLNNSLFLINSDNPLVKKTITLSNDINDIINMGIDDIIKLYIDVI